MTEPQASTPVKRSRTSLLRDYYGLPSGKGSSPAVAPPAPAFDADEEYRKLLAAAVAPGPPTSGSEPTYALPGLLKHEAELLSQIRELDGERQSLVYNHHHELIAASETIKKMNQKAVSLDSSLSSLQSSFDSIAQLSGPLYQPKQGSLPRPRGEITVTVPTSEGDAFKSINLDAQQQHELQLIVSLPERLREMIAAEMPSAQRSLADSGSAEDRSQTAAKFSAAIDAADKILQRDEPVVSKWRDAGNADAGRILEDARLVVNNGRELQRQFAEAA